MNSDIRLSVAMPNHPKTIKLMRRCGDRAFYHLVKLLCWVGQNRPEGVLDGMDEDSIEIAAGWDGESGALTEALVDLGWLDHNDVYSVHDWDEHNGWACGAKSRSESARVAAKARWEKRIKCGSDAAAYASACDRTATARAPSPSPSPNPNPTQRDKRARKWPKDFKLTEDMRQYAIANRINPDMVDAFFEDFRNWSLSKGATYKDWPAAFRTRVLKAPEYSKQFIATGGDDARFSNLR
jgi:hypothetical protein